MGVTPIEDARPRAAHAKLMKSCGLNPKHGEQHGIVPLAPHEVDDLVGVRCNGIGFKYYTADGECLGIHRVRLIDPPKEDTPKYLQPKGTQVQLYFPQGHGDAWNGITTETLIITEGEKKAHAGCVAGVPTVGIGGVWMGAKKKVTNGKLLLPQLRALVENVGTVFVAFDSDRTDNPDVAQAETELVAMLRGCGVEARVIVLPDGEHGRQGLDDYLMANGKGSAAKRLRELIEQAEEFADLNSAWVKERNAYWARIENEGGEPYILIGDRTRMSLRAFDTRYAAGRATFNTLGKLVERPEGLLWRTHPAARSYTSEVFHTTPDNPPEGALNRYAPPAKPAGYRKVSLKPIHDFVDSIVSPEEKAWLYSWVAYAVQTGLRPEWGVFAWSEIQGAGKTFLGKLLGACFDPYYAHVDTADIIGKWGRKHFENRRFLLVDEGSSSERSGRELEEILKHALSGGVLEIEEKYQPTRRIENRCMVYLASNYQMTRHVGRSDRRTFLLHLKRAAPDKVVKAADALLHVRPGDRASPYRDDTRWALWDYFSKYKIVKGFDPVRAPMTEAKQRAIESGFSALELAVRELIEQGTWHGYDVPEVVSTKALATLSLDGQVSVASKERSAEAIRIGRALGQAHCEARVVEVRGKSERLWAVRNIDTWKRRLGTAWAAESLKMPTHPDLTPDAYTGG